MDVSWFEQLQNVQNKRPQIYKITAVEYDCIDSDSQFAFWKREKSK